MAIDQTHRGGQSSGCTWATSDRSAANPHSGHGEFIGVIDRSYPQRKHRRCKTTRRRSRSPSRFTVAALGQIAKARMTIQYGMSKVSNKCNRGGGPSVPNAELDVPN